MRIQAEDTLLMVIDIQTKLMPFIHNYEAVETKLNTLYRGLRLLDIPYLVMQQYTRGLGESIPVVQETLKPYEVLEKTTFSCCQTPAIMDAIKNSGRKTILLTGIETHICVQQTALDLRQAGYRVLCIMDCVGSRFLNDKHYAEMRMRDAGVELTTAESILFELCNDAKHPVFKQISALVK